MDIDVDNKGKPEQTAEKKVVKKSAKHLLVRWSNFSNPFYELKCVSFQVDSSSDEEKECKTIVVRKMKTTSVSGCLI